jgi:chitodextrinase
MAAIALAIVGIWGYVDTNHSLAETASAVQNPVHDINANSVIGVGQSSTSLYKDVNDGMSFGSADDDGSYVRSKAGVAYASNTVSYDGSQLDSKPVSSVTVYLRAYKGSAASAMAHVELYDGATHLGAGSWHSLGSHYDNYQDTFSNLSVKNAKNLRTKVTLHNTSTSGAPRYTMVWIKVQYADGSASSNEPTPTPPADTSSEPTPPDSTPTTPPSQPSSVSTIRAAFYYPWFPEAWQQQGYNPFTNYHPTAGYYSAYDQSTVANQIKEMKYAHLNAAIYSWWGQGTQEDKKLPAILKTTDGTGFKWALYYEKEGFGDPSVSQLTSDLQYIKTNYTGNANYLYYQNRPVIMVYGDANDGCGMADRWDQANAKLGDAFYVVLKVFPNYAGCKSQPDNWHQYAPSSAEDHQNGHSFVISPGFYKKGESSPRLVRSLSRWNQNIKDMVASNEPIQLVTTFNEWGEGTAVEPATEWSSTSGYGTYLDALHNLLPTPDYGGSGQPGSTNSGDPIIAAAGDIACDPTDPNFNNFNGTAKNCQMKATSDLVLNLKPNAVLTMGDDQYIYANMEKYDSSFQPTWGRFKAITHPIIGNHEGGEGGSNAAYFQYWGSAAGSSDKGYYSYNIGKWHLIALNSNCGTYSFNGSSTGCEKGSPQEVWLKQDLAANPNVCTLAYWHTPLFTSGGHGDTLAVKPLYEDLYTAHADIVLNGHDHNYERFAKQNPSGQADVNGIREFVVGTGGESFDGLVKRQPNSEVWNNDTFGVIKLTLHDNSYDWQFVPIAGKTFTDSGSGTCNTKTAKAPDTQAPSVPTGLKVLSTTSSQVSLSWTASTDNVGVNHYNVFRNNVVVGTSVTPNYTDNTAQPGTTYNYSVSAVDAATNESAHSTAVTVTTPPNLSRDTQPPSVPANLKAVATSETQVNLTWNASTDNVGVAGYQVYRDGKQLATVTSGTSYGDASVNASTTYSYAVKAYDAAGNVSLASGTATVTTPTPPSSNPVVSGGPCGVTTTAPAKYSHVIVIFMENHRYSDVIGSSSAPYMTSLAKGCGTATSYSSVGSPSLPNYIGFTSGSTQGISDDKAPASHVLTVDNIFRQVRTAGLSEKSYEESMPGNCALTGSGNYQPKHNPASYYTGGSDRQACQSNDVPLGTTSSGALISDLKNDTLPNFSFITPNMCNDTHDCSTNTGDKWLSQWVPQILDSKSYKSGNTALLITYDEYTHMPTMWIAPSVKPGTTSATNFNHYSLLRTVEDMLGLKSYIGGASGATSMRSTFNM